MNEAEYEAALAEISKLMETDPEPASEEGKRLMDLAIKIEAYEKIHYPEFNR